VDDLFTPVGYRAYAEDLLERMLSPYLLDTVQRIIRDPRRKLGWNDRLVGTVRLALQQGIVPWRYATGAAAAAQIVSADEGIGGEQVLDEVWADAGAGEHETRRIREFILAQDPERIARC
jgi:mannitol-1-phosphate/altronate dehydrogenase